MNKLSPIIPFKKLPNTKAWKTTSEYVRKASKGVCYTCGRRIPFKKLCAGHFREKIGNAAIYFDLRGLRGQCFYCNRRLHGAKDVYARKLQKDDPGAIEHLFKLSQKSKVWRKEELEIIYQERSKLLEELNQDA